MSKMYQRGHRFIAMQQSVLNIEGGKNLSGKTWTFLYWLNAEAQRRSSNRLLYSNGAVAAAIGVHAVNVPDLRSALVRTNLLKAEKTGRDGYTYILLDPTTASPIDEPVRPTVTPEAWGMNIAMSKELDDAGWCEDDAEVTA